MDIQDLFGRDSVHTALKRWRQADKLGAHPLATMQLVQAQMSQKGYGDSARGRGLALREVLSAAITQLGPPAGEEFDPWDKLWRAYVVLEERFKQRRGPDYVAEYMGLGRSAYYREQSVALGRLGEWLQQAEQALAVERAAVADEAAVAVPELRTAGTPFLAPSLPPYRLVGRDAMMAELRQHLTGEQAQPLWAVHGLPGGGKTALTIVLAHDEAIQAQYPDGILWVGLGPQPDTLALLGTWCLALGLDAGLLAQMTTIRQRAQYIHATIGGRRMLLIVDDAWQIEDALVFKVGGAHCTHVVTTRLPEVAVSFAGERVMALQELSVGDGVALLHHFAAEAVAAERPLARELVTAVGGLPLALVLIGHHLQKAALRGRGRRVSQALAQLQQVEKRLALSQPQSPLERHSNLPVGTALSLISAIEVSDAALTPTEQAVLRLLSVFPPKPNSFAEEAALAVAVSGLDELDGLVDAGLLEFVEPDRYMMHQSIADYARMKVAAVDKQAAEKRFITFFSEYAWQQREDFQELNWELDNILMALTLAEAHEQPAVLVQTVNGVAHLWRIKGLYELAEKWLTVTAVGAQTLGDLGGEALALSHLGAIAHQQGEIGVAEGHWRRGLDLAYDADDDDIILTLLTQLGDLADDRGQLTMAEMYWRQGLTLAENKGKVAGKISLLTYLGHLLRKRGNYKQAEMNYREALALAEATENKRLRLNLMTDLGLLFAARDDYAGAQAYYQAALGLAETLGYRERISYVSIYYGDMFFYQGEWDEAAQYYGRGLFLAQEMGHRSNEALALGQLGQLAWAQGKFDEAASLWPEALALARAVQNQEQICILLSYQGAFWLARERYEQAEQVLKEGVNLALKMGHNGLVCGALHHLGVLYMKSDQAEEAAVALQDSEKIAREVGLQRWLALGWWRQAQLKQQQGDREAGQALGKKGLTLLQGLGHYQAAAIGDWLVQSGLVDDHEEAR